MSAETKQVKSSTLSELDVRVGRLLIARIPGHELDQATLDAFRDGTIGGAVIFKENAVSLEQLAAMMREIVSVAKHVPVMMIDQEGGAVQRLDHVISPLPSPMALAATADDSEINRVTTIGAEQLRKLGFNCQLAPVLDVLTNPKNPIIATRALGDTPQAVAARGRTMARAINEAGLVAVGKHFPGHGSTYEDSHSTLAINPADCETLWRRDVMPFKDCLEDLPAILSAHVWVQSVDQEGLPASLSRNILQGALRGYLGYDGLIMTDDMVMHAITERWGLAEASAMALEAGNDLLLVCSSPEETAKVRRYIVDSIQTGRISEERLNDAIQRTEKLFPTRQTVLAADQLDSFKQQIAEDTRSSQRASENAIAQLRGTSPDVTAGSWCFVVPKHSRYPMNLLDYLKAELSQNKKLSAEYTEVRYSLNPGEQEIADVLNQVDSANVVFLTYRTLLNEGQKALANQLALKFTEGAASLVVCTDVPFDVFGISSLELGQATGPAVWENVICTFDPSELAMKALAKQLAQNRPMPGKCPVSLELLVSAVS